MPYLLKSEPDQYSLSDLERDGETLWDGVANPAAVKHLGEMHAGDKLIYYHTGKERQAVGAATVKKVELRDPKKPQVHIRFAETFSKPRTLADIKADPLFADSPLVRQGRLSVVPLTEAQYSWFKKNN